MAVRALVYYPDDRLRKVGRKVQRVDDEVRRLLSDMAETMYAFRGIGLAAPQVGVNRRVIVVHAVQDEERGSSSLIGMVNPEIIEKSPEQEMAEEGCMSIPGVHADVLRSQRVVVEGLDADGNRVRIETDGLEARVFLHEIDHLNGVLFIDYLDSLTRDVLLKKYLEDTSRQVESKAPDQEA
ncbi:MAG: peptide deformylase [Planctomycetes bacterium]|nr:peptide deformylase [Planctomycetota bacterium]